MAPRSKTLFHFTKNADVLCQILLYGFWPRYCLEDVQWQNHLDHEFVAFPMSCFCDIPISRISDHIGFYGSYGIGLTKEWAIRNGLNPVIYFSGNNPLYGALQSVTKVISELQEPRQFVEMQNIRHILSHVKPISGRMVVSGTSVFKDFYQESEWRIVPRHPAISDLLLYNDYIDVNKLNQANFNTSNYCRISFMPTDVKYIFVHYDSDIPLIMNFIQTNLDWCPNVDLKILMSRVTSLESISRDV